VYVFEKECTLTTLAQLLIIMGMDTTGVTAGAAKAQTSLATLGTGAVKSLSPIGVGALAAGAGIAVMAAKSIGAAMDFDTAFQRIGAISNASAKDIESWKGEVLSLAGETAKAPKELADALFFLSSAGLDAKQIMPALEASAKAAASGLGETADVANIVASALNAYSDSGLTAAGVTDTLVAAVREGRAEPEEFAGALGRILPIASAVGVTFDQVAGSMAVLSNIGLDVNEAVTAMRGVMQALAAPGTEAAKAMEHLGLSAQDLLDAISEDGIIGALRLLDTAARASTKTQADYFGILQDVVPNIRSLTGVLGLTGQAADKVDAIFANVADSTGDTDKAFKTTSEGSAFQIKQALNDIAIAGQKIATDLLPALADLLGVLAEIADIATAPFEVPVVGVDPALIERGKEYAQGLNAIYEGYSLATGGDERFHRASEALAEQFGVSQASVEQRIYDMLALADATAVAGAAHFAAGGDTERFQAAQQRLPSTLDKVAEAARKAGHGVQSFAGMGEKALTEFSQNIVESVQVSIGQFEKLEDAFSTTPRELAKQARLAVQIARQQHADLKEIFSSKDLGDAAKAALANLPADQRHAWAEAGGEVKKQIAQDAVALKRLNDQSAKQITGNFGKILHEGGRTAGRQLGAGAAEGITAGGGAATAAATSLGLRVVANLNNALGNASPSKEGRKAGADLMEGVVQGMLSHENKLLRAAEKVLGALQDKLSDMLSKSSSFGQGIQGGFSSLFDISGAAEAMATGQSPQNFFQGQATTAGMFADVLQALATQGAGKALLSDIAGMGPEGIPFAQGLLQQGPAGIAEVNKAYSDIARIAEKTADSLTNRFFGEKLGDLRRDVKDQKDVLVDIKQSVRFLEKISDQLANDRGGNVTINTGALLGTREEVMDWIRQGLVAAGRSGKGHH